MPGAKRPPGQSWLHSHLEAVSNIVFGLALATAANYLILPFYGFEQSVRSSFEVALIFTAISYFRSLLLRRFWNWITIR